MFEFGVVFTMFANVTGLRNVGHSKRFPLHHSKASSGDKPFPWHTPHIFLGADTGRLLSFLPFFQFQVF
ncbi:hypothetical protein EL17_21755 [Anditalea andensis]|uniref:Uncharacterized protein n=1 Tax=Anditalea andensis TaxID=1048983 RepID=A0A074KSB7_9BACT|nr:hypothetical protein EL17_21755 [Anditalea andensis]